MSAKKTAKPDRKIELAEAEYTCGSASLRDVAAKYGLSVQAVAKASRAGGWVHKRAEYRKRLREESLQMSLRRDTAEFRMILSNSAKLLGIIQGVIDDPDGLRRYIVTEGADGAYGSVERTFRRVDTAQLKQLADAQKVLMDGLYKLCGVATQAEEAAQKNAREKLAMEREKLDREKEKDSADGVVIRIDAPDDYGA